MQNHQSLSADQAWQPYDGPWNRHLAAHLYRRAAFGATAAEVAAAADSSPADLVRRLIHGQPESEPLTAEFSSLASAALATNNADTLAAGWLYRMLRSSDSLREKMTLFWHGHFATGNEKVQNARLMQQQNELLREHALGDFRKLAHGIAKDPAMLIYLDSESNRKAHPNENFAREVMELFVLGEGNYTEQDVRELARCFTGWELRRDRFRFNRYQHDRGEKTVLGQTGTFSGEDGIDIVLAQDAGPRFIARKLIQFFVFDEPQPSEALIEPLALALRDSDWNLAPALQMLLTSRLFYSDTALARKVRSPVELAVGTLRSLEASGNMFELALRLRAVGQGLFYPPSVKGWDGGRTWINSSTLLARANMVHWMMTDDKTRFAGSTLDALLRRYKVKPGRESVRWLEQQLLAIPLPEAVSLDITELLKSDTGSVDHRLRKAVHAMSLAPEFQLA